MIMRIPEKIAGLRPLTILLAVYFVVWIVLEGDLTQTVVLGVGSSVVAAANLWQRWGRGRELSRGFWLLLMTGTGLVLGAAAVFVTLFFMAVKTGLHAHGPEFTPAEIRWVVDQLPLWAITATLTTLGLASLILGMNGPRQKNR
jgi:hypothetical protein